MLIHLQMSVQSIQNVVEIHDATNLSSRWWKSQAITVMVNRIQVLIDLLLSQERANVTGGRTLNFDVLEQRAHIHQVGDPVHVYLLFSNDDLNSNQSTIWFKNRYKLTFENEILGVFTIPDNTIAMTGFKIREALLIQQ